MFSLLMGKLLLKQERKPEIKLGKSGAATAPAGKLAALKRRDRFVSEYSVSNKDKNITINYVNRPVLYLYNLMPDNPTLAIQYPDKKVFYYFDTGDSRLPVCWAESAYSGCDNLLDVENSDVFEFIDIL
jgi:hypothetical protein